jgi:hypothetical protein
LYYGVRYGQGIATSSTAQAHSETVVDVVALVSARRVSEARRVDRRWGRESSEVPPAHSAPRKARSRAARRESAEDQAQQEHNQRHEHHQRHENHHQHPEHNNEQQQPPRHRRQQPEAGADTGPVVVFARVETPGARVFQECYRGTGVLSVVREGRAAVVRSDPSSAWHECHAAHLEPGLTARPDGRPAVVIDSSRATGFGAVTRELVSAVDRLVAAWESRNPAINDVVDDANELDDGPWTVIRSRKGKRAVVTKGGGGGGGGQVGCRGLFGFFGFVLFR